MAANVFPAQILAERGLRDSEIGGGRLQRSHRAEAEERVRAAAEVVVAEPAERAAKRACKRRAVSLLQALLDRVCLGAGQPALLDELVQPVGLRPVDRALQLRRADAQAVGDVVPEGVTARGGRGEGCSSQPHNAEHDRCDHNPALHASTHHVLLGRLIPGVHPGTLLPLCVLGGPARNAIPAPEPHS
jgi:hypothetical protein